MDTDDLIAYKAAAEKEAKLQKPKSKAGRKPGLSIMEVERRIDLFFDAILKGETDFKKFREIAERENFNIGERQIFYYLNKAKDKFAKLAKTRREAELGKSIARINSLFFANVKICDYKGALDCQKELNKMLGLQAPDEINVKADVNAKIDTATKVNIIIDGEEMTITEDDV